MVSSIKPLANTASPSNSSMLIMARGALLSEVWPTVYNFIKLETDAEIERICKALVCSGMV